CALPISTAAARGAHPPDRRVPGVLGRILPDRHPRLPRARSCNDHQQPIGDDDDGNVDTGTGTGAARATALRNDHHPASSRPTGRAARDGLYRGVFLARPGRARSASIETSGATLYDLGANGNKRPEGLRLELQSEDTEASGVRAGNAEVRRGAGRCVVYRPSRTREELYREGDCALGYTAWLQGVLSRGSRHDPGDQPGT